MLAGLVAGLAWPGGNITGLSIQDVEVGGKRLELLKDAVPHASRIAVLWNAAHPAKVLEWQKVQAAGRALRALAQMYPDTPYVFVSERKGPLIETTFRKIMARSGEVARLGFPVHPHMLRHATGFKLANDGHDTRVIQHDLGHKNIQHTVGYTVLSAARFHGLWND